MFPINNFERCVPSSNGLTLCDPMPFSWMLLVATKFYKKWLRVHRCLQQCRLCLYLSIWGSACTDACSCADYACICQFEAPSAPMPAAVQIMPVFVNMRLRVHRCLQLCRLCLYLSPAAVQIMPVFVNLKIVSLSFHNEICTYSY
jgi:hypothetical protein